MASKSIQPLSEERLVELISGIVAESIQEASYRRPTPKEIRAKYNPFESTIFRKWYEEDLPPKIRNMGNDMLAQAKNEDEFEEACLAIIGTYAEVRQKGMDDIDTNKLMTYLRNVRDRVVRDNSLWNRMKDEFRTSSAIGESVAREVVRRLKRLA